MPRSAPTSLAPIRPSETMLDLALLAQLPQTYAARYYNTTHLHPLGALAVAVCGMLTLSLPRRLAMFPFLVVVCFIPSVQRLNLGGLDFTLLRIMILFGWIRILSRGELQRITKNRADTIIVAWALAEAAAYILLRRDFSSVVYMAGLMFDSLGMYFIVRALIKNWEDLQRLAVGLVIVSVPMALAFAFEKLTSRNLFALFGGASAITSIRDGKLRAVGAFSHPILSGCFMASIVPFMVARWWTGGAGRMQAVLGFVCSTIVILACASSTPMAALFAGIMAAFFWILRTQMQSIRWGIVAGLIGLHFVMEQPVWHLICRVDLAGGSTGWHRFLLIDNAIHRVGEWGLLGTVSTIHWGRDMHDITNQFVLEGVRGGLSALILFSVLVGVSFANVGTTWRRIDESDFAARAMSWALGVSLFIHFASFWGVSYFGQTTFSWFLTVGAIASMATAPVQSSATQPAGPTLARPLPELVPDARLGRSGRPRRPSRRGVLREIRGGA